eukprot:1847670-Alexandrium_andersonii.AAC.2
MPCGAQRPRARGPDTGARESLARRTHEEEVVPTVPEIGEDLLPQGVVREIMRGMIVRCRIDYVDVADLPSHGAQDARQSVGPGGRSGEEMETPGRLPRTRNRGGRDELGPFPRGRGLWGL